MGITITTGFYVTLQRQTSEGIKTAWLLGPFRCHETCKARVREACDKAYEIDPRTHFDPFGTASIATEHGWERLPAGKLNSLLPHLLEG